MAFKVVVVDIDVTITYLRMAGVDEKGNDKINIERSFIEYIQKITSSIK